MEKVFDVVYAKNGKSPVKLAGYHALNSLRMEKGYLHWGHDIGVEENPFEAGVGFCVNLSKKNPFLGQAALEEKKKSGLSKRKVNFAFTRFICLNTEISKKSFRKKCKNKVSMFFR